MIVGISGSRFGGTASQHRNLARLLAVELFPVAELHHGDCTGVDATSDMLAHLFGIPSIVIHPPIKTKFRAWCANGSYYFPPDDYHVRDYRICDLADVLIASPNNLVGTGGTWNTARYMRDVLHKPVMLNPQRRYQIGAWLNGMVFQARAKSACRV